MKKVKKVFCLMLVAILSVSTTLSGCSDKKNEQVVNSDYAFNEAWSTEHWMTKNYDSIDNVLNGEGG